MSIAIGLMSVSRYSVKTEGFGREQRQTWQVSIVGEREKEQGGGVEMRLLLHKQGFCMPWDGVIGVWYRSWGG